MSRVIIYGISHAGLRITSFLKETSTEVTVAVQEGSEFIPRLERLHVQVATGDLKDFGFLKSLHVDEAQSIILPSEDELFNLNAALHAVESRPEINVVLRLFNLSLGKKLENSFKNFTVLSVSELASSTFAIAALIEKLLLSFESDEEILAIYEINGGMWPGRSIVEIEMENEVKVISVNDETFPAAERQIGPGDKLAIFSRFPTASAINGIHACTPHTKEKRKEKEARKRLLSFIRQFDPVLLRTTAALIVVAAASVLFFHTAEALSFLDASYFVVTVLTTTGFGDISLKNSAAASKIVGMGVMLAGMALMAMLFAIISDNLLKKRLELFLGRRRIKLRDHVVLCGLGDIGIRILEDLVRINERVVVVEKNPEGKFIHQVRQQNIPLIISDATQEETLVNANIKEAKAIICATDNDIRNLDIGLNAQSLQPGIKVVLRIFEKELAEKIENNFDLHVALSSSAIAAPAFASAARGTGMIGMIHLNGHRLQVKEAVIDDSINTKALIQNKETKFLMAVGANGKIIINGIENSLEPGTTIVYLTSS